MAARRAAIAAGTIAALFLFLFFVYLFIPSGVLHGAVQRSLEGTGYSVRAARFGKAFPLGIKASRMEIADARGVLFRADQARVRLRLLPLFMGRVGFIFDAEIGGGSISGGFSPAGGGELNFEVSRVRLEDIPFFATAGALTARGEMEAEGRFAGSGNNVSGSARLEIRGVELAGVKIGELPLPDASYETVRGALQVKGGKAVVESFVLQGAGIYVRLSGDLPLTRPLAAAPLNLALEILPKPDFLERQKLVFLLLARYMVSPGNYQVPIKGTLTHPAVP